MDKLIKSQALFFKPMIQDLMQENDGTHSRDIREEERERKDKWEDWSEEQSDLFVNMFGEGSSDGIKDFYKNIGEMFNKVD